MSCFLLVAVLNNATMDMGIQICLQDPAFNYFLYIHRSRIAGSYGNFIFIFLRSWHMISTVALLFYINTNNVQGFQFLHILALPKLIFCFFFFFFFCVCVCVLIVTNLLNGLPRWLSE